MSTKFLELKGKYSGCKYQNFLMTVQADTFLKVQGISTLQNISRKHLLSVTMFHTSSVGIAMPSIGVRQRLLHLFLLLVCRRRFLLLLWGLTVKSRKVLAL